MTMKPRDRNALVLMALLFAAAGCSSGCSTETSGAGGHGGGGDNGGTCTGSAQCLTDQICDLMTHHCVNGPACTMNSECGPEAHCQDGKCTPDNPGGKCGSEASCPPG